MRVSKILNNNLVLSKNENNNEIIVKGRGIGFHARKGDRIDESMIEKIFYPENHQNSVQIQEYLLSIPEEYFDFTQRFVDRIKEENPDLQLNNSIYLSLSDHIMGTINRLRDGISLKNVLLLDIRQLYKKEYAFGERLVKELNEAFQVDLPLDEAGFMALHFVNAEDGQQNDDSYQIALIVNQVQEIVKSYFSDVTLHHRRHPGRGIPVHRYDRYAPCPYADRPERRSHRRRYVDLRIPGMLQRGTERRLFRGSRAL